MSRIGFAVLLKLNHHEKLSRDKDGLWVNAAIINNQARHGDAVQLMMEISLHRRTQDPSKRHRN
jgi:hypothetical protein